MRRAGAMRWGATAAAALACQVSVVHCGGTTESPPDGSSDATTSDAAEAPTDAGPADAASEKQWPIVYNVVDGGGDGPDCYPDGNIVQACCNGVPCRGFCIGDEDGAIECSCYGIAGGCVGQDIDGVPNVCCSTIRGCEDGRFCNPQGL